SSVHTRVPPGGIGEPSSWTPDGPSAVLSRTSTMSNVPLTTVACIDGIETSPPVRSPHPMDECARAARGVQPHERTVGTAPSQCSPASLAGLDRRTHAGHLLERVAGHPVDRPLVETYGAERAVELD